MNHPGGTDQSDAVTRGVECRTFPEGEARTVQIGRTYDAPLEDVWEACTEPERIRRWFLPVSGELREGGRYQLEGNAGGLIERCEPPHHFAASWEYGGNVSWIELHLSGADGGGTRFELWHTMPVGDHWRQFGPGAVGIGWDLGLLGLARNLATGESADPKAAAAFPASEAGRRFIEESSRGWCEADIASGEEREHASAAAARTFAFYTGAGPNSAS
ncbi:MAG: SRPBCC family protein [Solirubrobacterales bacterium]|nr:SRPBCC family protein [Solirubrobacterales bacterium]